jgi:hypothetical protein
VHYRNVVKCLYKVDLTYLVVFTPMGEILVMMRGQNTIKVSNHPIKFMKIDEDVGPLTRIATPQMTKRTQHIIL